jgi:hypothetical protein
MEPNRPFDHLVNPYFIPQMSSTDAGAQATSRTIAELLRRMRERQANPEVGLMPQVLTGPVANYNPLVQAIDPNLNWTNNGIQGPRGVPDHLDNPLARAVRATQPNPPLIVDENLIRGLLTRDFVSRKTRQWSLLTDKQMQTTLDITLPWLQGSLTGFEYSSNIFVVGRVYKSPRIDTIEEGKQWPNVEKATIHRLESNYPLITALLEEYHGRLIAAGGAVNWHLHRIDRKTDSDIDLFFIDPDIENDSISELAKQEKATSFLLEAVSFLVDQWLNHPPEDYTDEADGQYAYVCRGEFVTTIYLTSGKYSDPMKYQFIHRVYPNIGSVLGGFDLGPAMIAYTGRKIVATELGAWSALAKTIIVDTSRRSTSFEHRLTKYAQFCHVVFPGLPRHIQSPKHELDECQVNRLIHQAITDHGYMIHEVRGRYWELIKDDDRNRAMVEKLLHEVAARYGYEISNNNLRLTKVTDSDFPLDDAETPTDQACTVDDLKIMLVRLAYEHGYNLDIDDMIRNHGEYSQRGGFDSNYKDSYEVPYLTKRELTLKLTRLEISLKCIDQVVPRRYQHRLWNLRPRRDTQYELTSDYDGQPVFWPSPTYARENHDYGHGTLWPEYTVAANLTILKLCQDAIAPVVSICAFKNSTTSLPEGERMINPSLKESSLIAMHDLFTDVDKVVTSHNRSVKNKVSTTPRQVLKDKLVATIQDPQLGDFNKIYACYDHGLSILSSDVQRKIQEKAAASRLHLVGIRWIVRNPGTQWTSSINPIVEHPRDWYGSLYRSFKLGDEAVETCLRLIRLRPGNFFSVGVMPRDVFRLVLISLFS